MDMAGNTILITGGGSGIGRGLAETFHAADNHVIIAGRRLDALQAVADANPGMAVAVLDVADPGAITAFAGRMVAAHPALNVLVNNAGIMRAEDATADPFDLAAAEETVTTNLLGPIRLTAALLPHLRRQPSAAILNVTSGLAFVPLAGTPTYSATKAAMHSYTQALRHQLRQTAVQVLELAPPLVATDLTPGQSANPHAMPLDEFIRETMSLLAANPGGGEVLVDRVKPLRFAEAEGKWPAMFGMLNPG